MAMKGVLEMICPAFLALCFVNLFNVVFPGKAWRLKHEVETTCCSWQHHCDALAPMPGPWSTTVLYDACGFQCLAGERARTLCKHLIGSSCFSLFLVC